MDFLRFSEAIERAATTYLASAGLLLVAQSVAQLLDVGSDLAVGTYDKFSHFLVMAGVGFSLLIAFILFVRGLLLLYNALLQFGETSSSPKLRFIVELFSLILSFIVTVSLSFSANGAIQHFLEAYK